MSPINPAERLASHPKLTAALFAGLAVLGGAGTAAAGSCVTTCGGP